MKTDIEYISNGEQATTICVIKDKNAEFIGTATCHADDMPYASQLTGGYIAESRALLKMLQFHKHEVRAQISALEHVYGCMKANSKHNPNSIESRLIRRQIHIKKNELAELKCDIENLKQNMREYISLKEKQYQKYRQAENN